MTIGGFDAVIAVLPSIGLEVQSGFGFRSVGRDPPADASPPM